MEVSPTRAVKDILHAKDRKEPKKLLNHILTIFSKDFSYLEDMILASNDITTAAQTRRLRQAQQLGEIVSFYCDTVEENDISYDPTSYSDKRFLS